VRQPTAVGAEWFKGSFEEREINISSVPGSPSGILEKLHSQAVQELSILGSAIEFALDSGAGGRGAVLPAY
jgi:hypothetical protein